MAISMRWRSRKFLVTLAAQVTAILTLLWPQHETAIAEASGAVTALLVMGLTAVGYVVTEGTIDRNRASHSTGERAGE
ncbi:MAG: hypothetical protein ACOC1G_03260 [Phycisphaeraceae bacterium]